MAGYRPVAFARNNPRRLRAEVRTVTCSGRRNRLATSSAEHANSRSDTVAQRICGHAKDNPQWLPPEESSAHQKC